MKILTPKSDPTRQHIDLQSRSLATLSCRLFTSTAIQGDLMSQLAFVKIISDAVRGSDIL